MRLILAALLALACAEPPPPAPSPPRDRPVGPGAPMNLDKPDRARVALDVTQAAAAIKMHHATTGGYPASLGELGLRLHYPKDLVYDPGSGGVRSATYPEISQ